MITIDFSQKTPIYKQLVEQLTRMIKSGELKPGDRLPTERDLAETLCRERGKGKKERGRRQQGQRRRAEREEGEGGGKGVWEGEGKGGKTCT